MSNIDFCFLIFTVFLIDFNLNLNYDSIIKETNFILLLHGFSDRFLTFVKSYTVFGFVHIQFSTLYATINTRPQCESTVEFLRDFIDSVKTISFEKKKLYQFYRLLLIKIIYRFRPLLIAPINVDIL